MMRIYQTLSSLALCLALTGCVAFDASDRPPDPTGRYENFSFVAEIPVVRPSKIGLTKVKTDAMALVKKHGVGNSVASLDMEENLRFDAPPSDEKWLKNINALRRWKVKRWNYDAGTTAQVYLHFSSGSNFGWGGMIVFVKDGKELGFRAVGGGRKLFGYYKDMAKLGYYIP